MKPIIIYESTHHENTKKLVDALAKKHNMKTVSIENAESVDLSEYDIVGLAAGIAFGKFYKRMEEFAAKSRQENRCSFSILAGIQAVDM